MRTAPIKSPGSALEELLIKRCLTQKEAARILGTYPSYLNMLIKDKARISAKMAISIERNIGGSADQFVFSQAAVDLAKARAKVMEIAR